MVFAYDPQTCQDSGILEEHMAVRQSAGLFDVSHMGLLEFSGQNVHLFVNTITSNDIALLDVGRVGEAGRCFDQVITINRSNAVSPIT
ncbi:MAG: hypothetical protein ACK2T2_03495 [Anaerolineales bacterium]